MSSIIYTLFVLRNKCRYVPILLLYYEYSNVTTLVFMNITTISSREFNQDVSKAKRAALKGPVFITDRGRPAHVLLTIEVYQKVTEKKESIVELLAMPDAADVEFEPPRLNKKLYRPADLS